jgi:hypothetical protein
MKKIELILGLLGLVGVILGMAAIPGGSILSVLALCGLSVFYFYFSFAVLNGIHGRDIFKKAAYKDIAAADIVSAIGAGIALSIVVIGLLFKVMFWPGGSFMLLAGCLALIIAAIIGGIRLRTSKSAFPARLLKRAVIFGSLGLLCFFLPSNFFLKIKYRQHPEYVKAVEAASANPDDEELQRKANEEHQKLFDDEGVE